MKQYELKHLVTTFTERFNHLYNERINTRDADGKKYTLYRIAGEIGISDTTMRKYLEGVGYPSFENILAIMEYFEVSFEWLIGREEYQSPEVSDGVEKYGMTEKAVTNLGKARKGETVTSMGDYSIETFNPIVSGNLDGKATYLVDNPVKQDPVRMTESVEKYDETLVTQELKTLNMMIEDWTIIRDVNAYLHSTPQEFAKQAKFNYSELDAFQLNLVNRELSRKKDEIFVREMANRPDAYKIRYGADGNQRIMTGDKCRCHGRKT